MSTETIRTGGQGSPDRPAGRTGLRARLGRWSMSHGALADRAWAPVAAGLICLATVSLIFTRAILLGQGFWGDEVYSVVHYISGGPASIFGGAPYVPNDHMLFELLAWATTGALGTHIEAVYRIWAVVPAIAAAAAMTWWLWDRMGRWPAAIFAVLAAADPSVLDLSWQARGYGLGFLAGSLITIGADRLLGRRSAANLALFAGGGLVGILTLPDFVLPFLTLAVILAVRQRLERTMIWTVIGVGLVSLAWYAPVLSSLISSGGQHFGAQLPWDGFVVNPLQDQVAPLITLAWAGAPLGVGTALAAALIAVGALWLARAGKREVILLLLAPAVSTYLVLEVGRLYVAGRFVSFLALPLLAAVAVGLLAVGRALSRGPWLSAAVVLLATCASLFVLGRSVRLAAGEAKRPLEAADQIAAMIRGTRPALPILTNSRRASGFTYYLGSDYMIRTKTAHVLERLFCRHPGEFLYIQDSNHSLPADTSCLKARGAFRVSLPERRATVALWFVPAKP